MLETALMVLEFKHYRDIMFTSTIRISGFGDNRINGRKFIRVFA